MRIHNKLKLNYFFVLKVPRTCSGSIFFSVLLHCILFVRKNKECIWSRAIIFSLLQLLLPFWRHETIRRTLQEGGHAGDTQDKLRIFYTKLTLISRRISLLPSRCFSPVFLIAFYLSSPRRSEAVGHGVFFTYYFCPEWVFSSASLCILSFHEVNTPKMPIAPVTYMRVYVLYYLYMTLLNTRTQMIYTLKNQFSIKPTNTFFVPVAWDTINTFHPQHTASYICICISWYWDVRSRIWECIWNLKLQVWNWRTTVYAQSAINQLFEPLLRTLTRLNFKLITRRQ